MEDYIIHTTPENYIYKLNLKGGLDMAIYNTGIVEAHIADIINKYVNKDSVSIDVGANFGCHAVRLGKKGKKVICFEPMPINERLKENLILNNINYELYDYLIGKENIDNISIFREHDFFINHSNINTCVIRHMRKIDDVININEKINFIKIDVDGMEHDVLLGLDKIILTHKPIIVTEYTVYALEFNSVTCELNLISDYTIMKQRWRNTTQLLLDKGYKIEYVAYTEYFNVPTPKLAEDFYDYFNICVKNNFSGTDVLFIPQ